MELLKGKLVSNQFYDVAIGTEVLVKYTEYYTAVISIASTGAYLDEVHRDMLYRFVELDESHISDNTRSSAKIENDESDKVQYPSKMTLGQFGAVLGIQVVDADKDNNN